MSSFISGQNLLTRLDILPFELFCYVKNGLQPFDKFGSPVPPPTITDKSERLKKLKMQAEENPRILHLTEGKIAATSLPSCQIQELNDVRKSYTLMNKSLHNEIESLTKELDSIENKLSWSAYELPDDKISAQQVFNMLLDSYFVKKDVEEIGNDNHGIFLNSKSAESIVTSDKFGPQSQALMEEGKAIFENIEIGYADFIRLCRVNSSKDWEPFTEVRPDGVWILSPDDDLLFPGERAALCEHPHKDLSKPALPFPCPFSEFKHFLEWLAGSVYAYVDEDDLNSFFQEKRKDTGTSVLSDKNNTELESKLQSIHGKIGGGKAKTNKPILEAVKQFIKTNSKITTNEKIANKFCNKYIEDSPMRVTVKQLNYEVFCQKGLIISRQGENFNGTKGNNIEKSIAFTTFRTRYIKKAKDELNVEKQQ